MGRVRVRLEKGGWRQRTAATRRRRADLERNPAGIAHVWRGGRQGRRPGRSARLALRDPASTRYFDRRAASWPATPNGPTSSTARGARTRSAASCATKIKEITVAAKLTAAPTGDQPAAAPGARQGAPGNMPKDKCRTRSSAAPASSKAPTTKRSATKATASAARRSSIDCMTDNRTRTVAEVRHAFSKHGGNLGTDGSVAFKFKHCGQFLFAPGTSEDKVMEVAIEAGADDVITDDDGGIEVHLRPVRLFGGQGGAGKGRAEGRGGRDHDEAAERNELAGDDARRCRSCSTCSRTSTTSSRSTPRAVIELRMKILVVGGGGREHALAWRLAQSARAGRLRRARQRRHRARSRNLQQCADHGDIDALADFAESEGVAFTVVGPEAPLAAGIVDFSARAACASSAPPRPRRSSSRARTSPRRS
jgi:transcriptional/translational regulatory protein YebC/TACO1